MNEVRATALEDAIRRRLTGDATRWNVVAYDVLPSTSDLLKALAAGGAPEGTVVVAREQTRGRGQRDHRWLSIRDKGLYLSVLLRPPWAATDGGWLTVAASLAVLHALCAHGIAHAAIQPPNDVWVGGRKIAGVLAEPRIGRGSIEFAVVGIGVNLSHEPADFAGAGLEATATSCAMLGRPAAPDAFAAGLLDALARLYAEIRNGNRDAVIEEWMHAGGAAEPPGLGA